MDQTFYICKECGTVTTMFKNSGVPVICCGQKMEELIPGSVEGSAEKHVPVYTVEDGVVCVNIGAQNHPMTAEHFIEWIALFTEEGAQYKYLTPADGPQARFAVGKEDKVEAVYAYCNLHGLWKA